MMEHTPGPWEVDGPWQVETDASRLFGEERRTDWRVHGVIGKPGRTIAEVGGWKDRPNAEADARLIAAAPGLLAVAYSYLSLHDIINRLLRDPSDSEAWGELDGASDALGAVAAEAIVKATGNDDEMD